MNDSKNGLQDLEDSVLLEMAAESSVLNSADSYEDMLIEKIAQERLLQSIDKTTGAPSSVRFAVGAAPCVSRTLIQ
jgi:uncharacterized membrane protein